MPTLAELLTVRSIDALLDAVVLPAMRGRGLNVTAWGALDPWRILAYFSATLRRGIDEAQATWTAAGFGEYVFGRSEPPGGIDVTSWAPIRARSWYGVEQIAATYTKRRILLTNTSAASYGPLATGKMIIRFTGTGNRYVSDEAATIPASGTVNVIFRSEFPVDTAAGLAYADPSNATITFVTANYPGVTATNPPGTYSDVTQAGYSQGTLTLAGAPTGTHSVAVRIDATGEPGGTATWSTSTDGAAWVSRGNAVSVVNLEGYGANVTLTAAASAPSFLAGSIFYFNWPGTDRTQIGRDVETPYALGTRCYAQWPSLAFVKDPAGNWIPFEPTIPAIQALTLALSDEIKIVIARTSTTISNQIEIRVAGQGALVSAGTLALVALYWSTFNGLSERYNVANPSTVPINLAGATVTASASILSQAQATAQARVNAYLTGVDALNPLPIGNGVAVIDRSYINSLIRSTPGVTHMDDGLTIEGAAADFTIPVDTLCTYAEDVAATLTWIPS